MRFRLRDLTSGLPQPHWAALALVWAAAGCGGVHAEPASLPLTAPETALKLKPSAQLVEALAPNQTKTAPIF